MVSTDSFSSGATPARTPSILVLGTLLGVLYLLTALLGVWAAYDRGAAWQRFALIAAGVVVALLIAWLGQWRGEPAMALIGLGCAVMAAGVAAYFVLTFDWEAVGDSKAGFAVFYRLGLWLQAHRPDLLVPEDIQRNVAGGALALTTPLAAGGVAWCLHRRRWRLLAWPALLAVLFSAFTLVLTMSRGALLGVGVGAMVAGYLAWRRYTRLTQRWLAAGDALFAVLALAAILGVVFLLNRPLLIDQSTASRPQLWRWALDLIADYPFTGSGLRSTMMVHATYLLIIHVGFVNHMHNLFLQIGVEQGLFGMAAFLALLALAIANLISAYRRRGSLWLVSAAIVTLSALMVHGVFDAVPFYSLLASITFLPLGFALGLTGAPASAKTRAVASRLSPATLTAVVALLVAASLALVVFMRPGQAALQTNLGAVAQTRAELSIYTWPEWPIQDALRRSPQVDLAPAIVRYQAALAIDPQQPSANRRLGQIEMSQGRYNVAHQRLQTAYQRAPRRQANRYLLGESYAIAGQAAEATDLWRTTSSQPLGKEDWLAQVVLMGREYWYDSIGEPQRAEGIRRARALLMSGVAP